MEREYGGFLSTRAPYSILWMGKLSNPLEISLSQHENINPLATKNR